MTATAPESLEDRRRVGPHTLEARVGVFGEAIVWECQHCKSRGLEAIYFQNEPCAGGDVGSLS